MKALCLVFLALAGAAFAQVEDWSTISFSPTAKRVGMKLDSLRRPVTLENNLGSSPNLSCQINDYNLDGTRRLSSIFGGPPDLVAHDFVILDDDTVIVANDFGTGGGLTEINAARSSLNHLTLVGTGTARTLAALPNGRVVVGTFGFGNQEDVHIYDSVTNAVVHARSIGSNAAGFAPLLSYDLVSGQIIGIGSETIFKLSEDGSTFVTAPLPAGANISKLAVRGSSIWAVGSDTSLDGGDWRVYRWKLEDLSLQQNQRVRGPGASVDTPNDIRANGNVLKVVGDSGANGMQAIVRDDGFVIKKIDPGISWKSVSFGETDFISGGLSVTGATTAWVMRHESPQGELNFESVVPEVAGQELLDFTSIVVDSSFGVYQFGTALDSNGEAIGVLRRNLLYKVFTTAVSPPGGVVTGSIQLNQFAPRDLTFNLQGTNGASTPATATISAGSSSVSFDIACPSPSVNTRCRVLVNGQDLPWNNDVQVSALRVASVSVNPSTVFSGGSVIATITLNGPAPAGGTNVVLQDSSGLATTPASVFIPAGQSSALANITTFVSRVDLTISVTAYLNGANASDTFDLKRSTLQGVEIGPTSVIGGTPANALVKVNGLAAESNIIALTSNNLAAATVPSQVVVVKGQSQASFTVTTKGIAADATVTITGTMNSISQTDTLLVKAAKLITLTLPASVPGGSTATGTLTTDGIMPPGGPANSVILSDNSASLTTPANAVIPFLSTSTTFTVTALPVAANTNATVTAVFRGVTKTAVITVLRAVIQSIELSADAVVSGTPVTVTVKLSATAPTGGAAVTIQSSNPALFPVPASVFVPAGSRSISFVRNAGSTATTQTVTITAVRFGTASKVLTVVP